VARWRKAFLGQSAIGKTGALWECCHEVPGYVLAPLHSLTSDCETECRFLGLEEGEATSVIPSASRNPFFYAPINYERSQRRGIRHRYIAAHKCCSEIGFSVYPVSGLCLSGLIRNDIAFHECHPHRCRKTR
jgi:hypothetical protein